MMMQIAAGIVAIACVVLIAVLISTLLRVNRTLMEAERLLMQLNTDLPGTLKELRIAAASMNELAERVRDGVDHASVFLHAVGEVGETVQQVHDTVRGRGGTLLANVASVVAGFRAATRVVKERFSCDPCEGGPNNGG
jgi:uncharacterized protein YoxC